MRPLLLFVFSSLTFACGGGGPTTPARLPLPPSVASPPQAVDGISGTAITAVITPAQPARNERARVEAPGYLVREQLFTGEPIRLWPAKNETLVRQLVYVQGTTGAEIRLRRWEAPGFVVTLPPAIAELPHARETFERATTEASRVTGLEIRLGPDGPVRVVIDPGAFADRPQSCALARMWLRGDVIAGAEILYPDLDAARGLTRRCDHQSVTAHEVGHVLGLQHVDDPKALMNPAPSVSAYAAWEEDCMQVIYHYRRAGNAAPDREAGLGSGDARVRVEVID